MTIIVKHAITAGEILSPKEFAAKLVVLKGAAKEWHKLTHVMIASAVCHAHVFGDIRGIKAVIDMMPAGAKTNSMRQYVLTLGPVKWSDAGKKFKFDDAKQVKTIMEGGNNDLLARILNDHWSSFGPTEKADSFKPFDLKARLDRMMKEMNKALEAPDAAIRETIKAADVNAVAALRRQLFGEEA